MPAGFMSPIIGQHLGNFIGEFEEYDDNNNAGIWRTFMRIKVKLDVRKPLKKEKKVRHTGGDWKTVRFKYERLGNFCFLCGILGHTDQFCSKIFSLENDDGSRGWGPELRADQRRGGNAGGSGGYGIAKEAILLHKEVTSLQA